MIAIERVIAKVTELRLTCSAEAVQKPDRDQPEFAYGEAVGRDAAFAMILDSIAEMLDDERRSERDEEED